MAGEAVERALVSANRQAELKVQVPLSDSERSKFEFAQFKRSISLEVDLSRIDEGPPAGQG